ncbi:P-type conjugative transfer protein TrbG [Asticcacaulis excentricus]|uniref:P-type conjugative transfer protein TrbG n=1 Tax=Asticcacaulis excentricus (strain ATCC 15261 / DSM 4724 / KCTC 12464 / NCIMB 9791 / VKM B-1370 / CB 48) TaxID=573065 RepID=E8RUT9_ASTEC|nr:P-type conjugative transfer protein TrbG [Asticcacaulis excentricus]ADU14139.1 P-type conjugative transfer protein TrbG [Asticcacaulis excentricus CB 48]
MKTVVLTCLVGSCLALTLPAVSDAKPVRKTSPTARAIHAANAAATQGPEPGSYLNAVQVYTFIEGTLYRLFTAPDKVSDIVLQTGESLISVSAGDTGRWVIGDTTSGSGEGRQTHILVKPYTAGLRTNLIITTDRRTYHLQLESTRMTAMAAVTWRYPQDQLLTKKAEAPVEVPSPPTPVIVGLSLESLRFSYTITGARPAWRPVRAFDDGQKVYIEFPADLALGQAPPLFSVGADGKPELLNYRVQGRFYVTDVLFSAAELRLGARRQSVVRITRTGEGAAKTPGVHHD